ncbi:HD domain-containing protein [Ruminococcus sp.]|uniref:CCA tRNA nucleotidyltransferase n=1 Tax=Ruminococcus sp. TaxID=41978 RepID=UPI0025DA9383|nr:HD domain-containing protein [Ruminococcus sp.]MBQ8967490.1 HD domain-containing protein [Ruminococcus sp.]
MDIKIPGYVTPVLNRLLQNEYESYIVGGCVRDAMMNNEPHDYDVCTNCTPDKMVDIFKDFHTIETGLKHGTLTIMSEHMPVEVTTYRSDGEYTDHRRPDTVKFETELREDLKRRDFTINAMCYNPDDGLVDMFGGAEDLKNKLIRCVGTAEERFDEDALRILRALRFASVLDFNIEENTAAAMRSKAYLLSAISAERIFSELKKLLCGKAVCRIMTEYSDLITIILPEISDCIGCVQNNVHHCYDVYEHICHSIENIEPDEELRLTMLFHDIAKPSKKTTDEDGTDHFKLHQLASADVAEAVLSRLKSSNKTLKLVADLVREHDDRILPKRRSVKRFLAKYDYDFFDKWLKVRRADTLAQSNYLRAEKLAELDELTRLGAEIKEEMSCLKVSDLAINGHDMISLGFQGQQIKSALNFALDNVIDELVENDHDILVAFIKENFNGQP